MEPCSDLARLKQKLKSVLMKGEFTLASGRKSSYYLDCRLLTLDQEGAHLAACAMLAEIRRLGATAVGGMSVGADPLVSTVGSVAFAQGIRLRLFYVRKEPKAHGTRKLIEGPPLSSRDRVVMLEDVATTGNSALKAADAVRDEYGAEVPAVLCIVDRQEGAADFLAKHHVKLISIFKVNDLL